MLSYRSVKKGRKKNVSTWEIEYCQQMVLTTCLLKTIDHNPLHPDPHKIIIQEGMNLLQHLQVICMEMEHNTILGQKFIRKYNDKVNEVVHTSVYSNMGLRMLGRRHKALKDCLGCLQ